MSAPTKKGKPSTPRRCVLCGAVERVTSLGYTNLSPYGQVCVDCINRDPERAIAHLLSTP